ncbi:hypothetical protein EYF80_030123 [Liparis tanakae]|uniref:Uncharacterized protein n=1 Tax=Liparis tanakae TaxID=230148 RepID=A0A4Z2H179_9TELE|nr:hypothetical protein EYF80_030123 [Liparis tanakae]
MFGIEMVALVFGGKVGRDAQGAGQREEPRAPRPQGQAGRVWRQRDAGGVVRQVLELLLLRPRGKEGAGEGGCHTRRAETANIITITIIIIIIIISIMSASSLTSAGPSYSHIHIYQKALWRTAAENPRLFSKSQRESTEETVWLPSILTVKLRLQNILPAP